MLVPANSAAITFCSANPDFTATHMQTSGTQSAVALLVPALAMLTPVIVDLNMKAHLTRGSIIRDAAQEALLVFPTLILEPQRPRTSSSNVKIEVAARQDLWR